ncbi:MAG: VOC family protein [Acidimicrobiia bacterium]
MADVKPIPEGYRTVTPYLSIVGAAEAIDWYIEIFGAKERMRMGAPGGTIGHAEIEIGDSIIMLADEFPDIGFLSPKTRGGTTVHIHLYVDDCDAVIAAAVKAGAKVVQKTEERFYGDRSGQIEDPFGHSWNVSTHVEDVPPEEMAKRVAAMEAEMNTG